ncbi:Phage tail fiber protein [Chromobacterium vaccinii]|nr:Phage tail fiber protein [Chromobacterium vaccinii]QND91742.1 Phage tail fiber protein [Chromobacterium vaccinii]
MKTLPIPQNPGWPSITQYEVTERLLGGPDGPLNRAPAELLERTEFLKKQIADLVSGALVAEYADRLKTPRTIAITGDGSWAVTFDGNGNVTGALTLANTGVAAGSYGIVTVDAKGRVTAGRQMGAGDVPAHDWSKIATGKPTTLDGYGITDAQPSSQDLTALANLKGAPGLYVNTGPGSAVVRTLAAGQGVTVSNGDGKAGNPTVALGNSGVAAGSYGIVTVDAMGRVTAGRQMTEADVPPLGWAKIANGKPTTLDGYGITDAQPASPDLTALANLKGAPGLYVNTGPGTAVVRTLAAGQGVTVSNGDGKAGNPTVALGNSGVAAGSYGIVTVDAMGRVTAGSKPTTLAGYGITDGATSAQLAAAMQYALGISVDPAGDLNSISVSGSAVYNSKTANRPSTYGVVITVSNMIGIPAGGTDQSCWVFQQAFGTDGTISQRRRVNAGDWSPWVLLSDAGPSGVVAGTYSIVTVDDRGRVTAGRQMTAADVPALDWSKITNKPATLAGYGIAAATQGEAEAGAENSKPMTALRVFQAIAKKVAQATEALAGLARIATQDETNAGDDDTAIVTPRKLRAGFACSLTENGFVAFPWWLGGFVMQWGRILAIPYDGSKRMPLPLPLSGLPFCSFPVIEAASVSPNGNYSVYAQHDAAGVTVYLDGNVTSGAIPQNAFVFSIGRR